MDELDSLIIFYMINLGVKTSNFAKGAPVYHGISLEKDKGFVKIIVEGDSRNIIMMLNGKASPS